MEQPLQTENFSDKADRLKNENCQRDLHTHMCVHMHKCSNSRHNDSSTNVNHLRVMGWLHGTRGPAQLHSEDQSARESQARTVGTQVIRWTHLESNLNFNARSKTNKGAKGP